jgi:tetratricopeptide (TPR) repeat protein
VMQADATDDLRLRARTHEMHARILQIRDGPTDEAMQAKESAIALAEAAGDLDALCTALINGAAALWIRGDFEREVHYCRHALKLAALLADPWVEGIAEGNLGEVEFIRGAWDEAMGHYERARTALAQVPSLVTQMAGLVIRCNALLLVQGDPHAVRQLEINLTDAEAMESPWMEGWARQTLAEHDLIKGRPDAASVWLEPMLERFGGQSAAIGGLRPLLAWSALERGYQHRAQILAREAVARARAEHDRITLVDALRVQALVDLRRSRWTAAERTLDEALVHCRILPYPWAEAKALYVYGQLYAARGETEQAHTAYQDALAILHHLGERLYAGHVERALAEDH